MNIVNALWYIRKNELHNDLDVKFATKEVQKYVRQREDRLRQNELLEEEDEEE